jgi:hypothetical protein
MCSTSTHATCCAEHARLEDEFQEARDRLRNLLGSRSIARFQFAAVQSEVERALAVQMAMAIARLKEHFAAHGCER